jgi:hypothetical protein
MSDSVPTIIIAAGGLALGAVSLVRELRTRTSRHHFDRATELYDLLDRTEARGPLTGHGSSRLAEHAHHQLLRSLESEARAHTILHVGRVGRLSRPGSYIVAVIASAYALVTASLAGQAAAAPWDTGTAVAAGIGVLATACLAVTGARNFIRRSRTRAIRRRAGLLDPVSVEGVTVAMSTIAAAARKLRRPPRGSTAASAE